MRGRSVRHFDQTRPCKPRVAPAPWLPLLPSASSHSIVVVFCFRSGFLCKSALSVSWAQSAGPSRPSVYPFDVDSTSHHFSAGRRPRLIGHLALNNAKKLIEDVGP